MKKLRLNNSSGDTIVEVLIVLAVLSLSFAISYATANGGLNKAQNSQEHSQALGVINSQIELLRTAVVKQNASALLTNGAEFCVSPTADLSATASVIPMSNPVPAACQQHDGRYSISEKYHAGSPTSKSYYEFSVKWLGVGSLGDQQERLTYKIKLLALAGGGGAGSYQGGTSGGGATYTPNVPPPTPPAPPARSAFSWTIAGASYSTCTTDASDTFFNDGRDGCFKIGDVEYSRRAVDIKYLFSSGTTTGTISPGDATLSINYNQYSGASTTIPSGYTSFKVRVKVNGTDLGVFDLPITSSDGYNTKNFSGTITIPSGTPADIEVDWINNTGMDPDLQINNIGLNYTAPTPPIINLGPPQRGGIRAPGPVAR